MGRSSRKEKQMLIQSQNKRILYNIKNIKEIFIKKNQRRTMGSYSICIWQNPTARGIWRNYPVDIATYKEKSKEHIYNIGKEKLNILEEKAFEKISMVIEEIKAKINGHYEGVFELPQDNEVEV